MLDLLARYSQWLTTHAPNTAAAARQPVTARDIADAEAEFDATFPTAVQQLYGWHDGGSNRPGEALWLTPEFGFLPLSIATEERRTSREIAEETFGPDEADFYWSEHWFPIGTSWTGDLLVVDCSASPALGRVTIAGHEGPVPSDPTWTSVEVLLRHLVEALENRAPLDGHVPNISDGWLTWDNGA